MSKHGEYSPLLSLAGTTATRKLEQRTLMGATGSKLEKALEDQFPEGERYFGLENFGNTCYCNNTLQVQSESFCFFFFFRFDFVVRDSISNGICILLRAGIFLVGLPYLQSQ